MRKFRQLLRQNWAGTAGVAVLKVLASLAMVFAGYSLSFLVTACEYDGDRVRALTITLGIVLAVWLSAMGIYYLSCLAQAKFRQHIKNQLRSMIGETVCALDYGEFVSRDCGSYVSWLTNDVDQLYVQSFAALFTMIEELSAALFSFAALLTLSWQVGAAALVLLAVISVAPQFASGLLQEATRQRSEALETSTERYKDTLMGGSIFFLSGLREQIVLRILRASREAEQVCWRSDRTNATVQTLVTTVSMVGQVVLVFVTLLSVVTGTTPTGAALSVGNLSGSFFNGASAFVQAVITLRASQPLWEKFRQEPGASQQGAQLDIIPEIRLENVSFRYGDSPVLEHESCTFRAGGKYALMGESGSGKSTLARLILGLLPGYTGRITYGGAEQRELAPGALYRHIAYVDQQVYLFQDTLRYNITLGQGYTDAEVMAVIRKCRLEAFLDSLPGGLDTPVLENGKNLSGGQRQRIALARSLIRGASFLILDEGTSALDVENALEIENALLDTEDLSVILITHDLRDAVRQKLTGIHMLT